MSQADLPPDLLRILAALEDPEAIARLLEDLLTPAETASLRERWGIVTRIEAGMTQRAVRDELGVAIATVSRGAQQLRRSRGGLALAFETLRGLEATEG